MLADRIGTRPMVSDPSSPGSFALARSWLSTCVDDHCHEFEPAAEHMPSRLLEVRSRSDGTMDARIISSEDTGKVPYLTLSYCWGGDQRSKTTEQSIEASKGVVDVPKLPQTIKDAITVTTQLGYSHLWVDSMCIIQDNAADKMSEISKMPDIYNNAVCAIAASFASNSRAGFLRDRSTYTRTAMKLQAQKTVRSTSEDEYQALGDPHPVLAYLIQSSDSLTTEPLSERGWCLQERLLSTRVPEYRRNQVRFLCPSTGDHDASKADGWVNDWPAGNGGDISFFMCSVSFVPATLLGWSITKLADFRRLWYSIVEAYTRRHLTFPSDRTLAISGIAQQIASMNKSMSDDRYIAGHWLSEFPQDLLWSYSCPDWTSNQRATRRKPTWAWTSIDTEVSWPQQFHAYTQQAAELIGLDVKLRHEDAKFGDVDDATPIIKGRVTKRAILRVTGVDYFPRTLTLFDKVTGEELCEPWLDAMTGPEDEEYEEDIVLLLIGMDESKDVVEAAGLVLCGEEESGGVRTYSRIGAWVTMEVLKDEGKEGKVMGVFEGCEVEPLKLI